MSKLRLLQSGPGNDWEIAPEFDDDRLEVIRLLHEACQIEHSLMLQYLYAAYFLKPEYQDIAGTLRDSSGIRPRTLVGVAVQEMDHLAKVNSILAELGAAPSLDRQDFPYEPGIYPFPMELEPLSRTSAAKYLFAEAPRDVLTVNTELGRAVLSELKNLSSRDEPSNHIGSLYRTVEARIHRFARTGRASSADRWIGVLNEIRDNGEKEHFEFFRDLFLGKAGSLSAVPNVWDDPKSSSYPSIPGPRNPTALKARSRTMKGPTAELARVGNQAYWSLLILLDQAYRRGRDPSQELILQATGIMQDVLHELALALAARRQGLPFDAFSLGQTPGADGERALEVAADLLAAGLHTLRSIDGNWLPSEKKSKIEQSLQNARDAASQAARRAATAVVIGGGPAGLAAAFALAERGVPVRLLELAPILGGKVSSQEIVDGERRWSVEHGVHGWWKNYLNFFALLERSAVDLEQAFLRETKTNLVIDKDQVVTMGILPYSLPSPIFLVAQLLRTPYLDGVRDLIRMLPFSIHILAFDHGKDYATYDDTSLETLLDDLGVPENAKRYLFRPFALNFDYALPSEVSASSLLSAFQFYVLPSEDSLLPRWTRGIPQRAVFAPLAKGIERRGGRIDRSLKVSSLVIEDGTLVALAADDTTPVAQSGAPTASVTIPVAQIPSSGFELLPTSRGPVFVGPKSGGGYIAFRPVCSHEGGFLKWTETQRFICTRHDGVFDGRGNREKGSPKTGIHPLECKEKSSTEIEILGLSARQVIRCTDAILATDLKSAQTILAASTGVPAKLMSQLEKLETTPVLVIRMWFPLGTKLTPGDYDTAVTPTARLVDNYFHLNKFHDSYDAEGEVVEVQGCRDSENWSVMPDDELVRLTLDDMKEVGLFLSDVPEPIHYEVSRHPELFTKYSPGSARHRPGVSSGVSGLHLAGDWTSAGWSAWFMERAMISGLRAANAVLEARGLEPFPILRIEPETWLLRTSRAAARLIRRLGIV